MPEPAERIASHARPPSMWRSAGLVTGLAIGIMAWLTMLAVFIVRDKPIPWFSVAYNVPITLLFLSLACHLAYQRPRLGRRRFFAAYRLLAVVWCAGLVILFLRLVVRSIDVSGHMSWALMMGTQSVIQRLPWWMSTGLWLVVLQVAFLKLFVIGGDSGAKGLAAGLVLSGATWVALRGRVDARYR